jgi:hypothetical protein
LVSYSLDPLKDTPNLYALRRQEQLLTDPALDGDTGDDAQTDGTDTPAPPTASAAYLIDHVAGLRFRYVDPETGQFVDSWDTTTIPSGRREAPSLPGAVEITLFLADDQGGVHDFTTIVDLPLANLAPTPGR